LHLITSKNSFFTLHSATHIYWLGNVEKEVNLLCFHLFCRCCCCWLHSTRRSVLKSINTGWRSVKFSKGMETSLDIFLSEGNMNIQAINIDDIYLQYNEPVVIFFSANLDWFLAQFDIKRKVTFVSSILCLIFWQSMHKPRKIVIIFFWLQNFTTDAYFNLFPLRCSWSYHVVENDTPKV